jgi:hypothetical protein
MDGHPIRPTRVVLARAHAEIIEPIMLFIVVLVHHDHSFDVLPEDFHHHQVVFMAS